MKTQKNKSNFQATFFIGLVIISGKLNRRFSSAVSNTINRNRQLKYSVCVLKELFDAILRFWYTLIIVVF